jgi:hypothetical protein
MTMIRTSMAGCFIAILVIGIVYAAVSPTLQPIKIPRIQMPWLPSQGRGAVDQYSLVKGTNASESLRFVNENITVKFGAVSVTFSNQPDLVFAAAFERDVNASELEVNYAASGDQALQVNLYGASGQLNITLGNSCVYNGSIELRLGGVLMELDQYASIGKLAVHVAYIGGMSVKIKTGASFEQLDLSMDIGGLQLSVDASQLSSSGVVDADMTIGGFSMGINVDRSQVGVSVDATVDTGGLSVNLPDFVGPVSSTSCSVKTVGYSGAAERLDIKASVGLGGGTLQQGIQSVFPGFSVQSSSCPGIPSTRTQG